MKKTLFANSLILFSLLACTNTTYDSGDGDYSYLQTDFVMAHTAATKTVDYVVTDDDVRIRLNPPHTSAWAETVDTLYRAMLYHHQVVNQETQVYALVQVPVLRMQTLSGTQAKPTDPVTFESAWLSRNRSFLNVSLNLKTGKEEGLDAKQQIGISLDEILMENGGNMHYKLRLMHAQNGVPEYYSSRFYFSIPLQSLQPGDKVSLTMNTYDGELTREFTL